jgi:hypothetical protein
LAIKKATQYSGGDFWPILIEVPGGFLMIFLEKQHQAMLFSKESFLTLFLWFLLAIYPLKKNVFLLKFRSLLRGLWALVAFLIPFPSWTGLW